MLSRVWHGRIVCLAWVVLSVFGEHVCPTLEGSYEATLTSLTGDDGVVGKVQVHRRLEAVDGHGGLALGGYAIGLPDGADCNGCSPTNCCGFHIHSGDSCENSTTQGGHLKNADDSDPWSDIKIMTDRVNGAEQTYSRVVGNVDWNYTAIEGKAFIVHDHTGARVACGLLSRITTTDRAASIAKWAGTSSTEEISGSVEVRAGTFAVLTCATLTGYPASANCSASTKCGAHVHSGTACTDTSTQGGHYPVTPVLPTRPKMDPWANDIMTSDSMTGTDDMGWGVTVVGSDYVNVDGKAFVVHDHAANARAACGVLAADNTCSCANDGTAATGAACTTDGANICTACTGEFYLNSGSCDAWAAACTAGQTETQSPSNTQNRVCAASDGTSSAATLWSVLVLAVPVWVAQV